MYPKNSHLGRNRLVHFFENPKTEYLNNHDVSNIFLCSSSHVTAVNLLSVVADTCKCCLAYVFCCWSVGASLVSECGCKDGEDGTLLPLCSCLVSSSASYDP